MLSRMKNSQRLRVVREAKWMHREQKNLLAFGFIPGRIPRWSYPATRVDWDLIRKQIMHS
mgnify:CR=1 FL=1